MFFKFNPANELIEYIYIRVNWQKIRVNKDKTVEITRENEIETARRWSNFIETKEKEEKKEQNTFSTGKTKRK